MIASSNGVVDRIDSCDIFCRSRALFSCRQSRMVVVTSVACSALHAVDISKYACSFSMAPRSGVVDDGTQRGRATFAHRLDDPLEQGLLGVEVVIERALGHLQLGQHVLDGHPLIALVVHEPQRRVEDLGAGVRRTRRASHGAP